MIILDFLKEMLFYLDNTIHEAGVSQVDQSSKADGGVFGEAAPFWIAQKDLHFFGCGLPMFVSLKNHKF